MVMLLSALPAYWYLLIDTLTNWQLCLCEAIAFNACSGTWLPWLGQQLPSWSHVDNDVWLLPHVSGQWHLLKWDQISLTIFSNYVTVAFANSDLVLNEDVSAHMIIFAGFHQFSPFKQNSSNASPYWHCRLKLCHWITTIYVCHENVCSVPQSPFSAHHVQLPADLD